MPALRGRPIDRATLLDLGTYTAGGLPLQFPDGVGDDAAALARFRAWTPQVPRGAVRLYSNPSIGLRDTHLAVPARAQADYAWGHRDDRQVRVNPGPLDDETYGIKATATDVARFVQAHIDPSALPLPLRRAIETTQLGRHAVGTMVQGLGWQQYAWPVSRETLLGGNAPEILFDAQRVRRVAPQPPSVPRLFDKSGSTGGFGTYVAFVPTQRIGVVLLANRPWPIAARVEAAHAILMQLTRADR